MRTSYLFLCLFFFALSARANDPVTKPIKPTSAKEEASAQAKEETKPVKDTKASRESKASDASRLKEAQAADELALKIAERLAAIRKDKDEVPKSVNRPYVRPYTVPARVGQSSLEKTKKVAVHNDATHWSYEGDAGPLSWGKLSSANTKCDLGERQSPIDIRDGIRVELDPINFDYKSVQFSVLDNGHTIQMTPGSGNYLNVSGKNYEMQQMHFHRPSEERINGKGAEMVAHLVHKDREGKLAVVAILMEVGEDNKIIQAVWNNLPLEKNEPIKALSNIDLGELIPKRRDYYTYMGSLTTPPCSEGVLWLVMKEPIGISPEQLAIFARLYPMNARPLQRSSGRIIKESR
ncbi:carbonic anhydrase [Undibacterium sp. Di24W]|uniref:carbonic anhydrase n=1 Tax=Undibacterium sp. Di24W TaxID=3413033 RepID=UPI003BF37F87